MTRAELQKEIDSLTEQRVTKLREVSVIEGALQAMTYVFDHTPKEQTTAPINETWDPGEKEHLDQVSNVIPLDLDSVAGQDCGAAALPAITSIPADFTGLGEPTPSKRKLRAVPK